MTNRNVLEYIAASPLLSGCGIDPSLLTVRLYRGGQIVSDRPGGKTSVGLVADGRVDVYSVALDGREVQLNALGAGECFGICNLLVPAEMETVLRCRIDTELIFIPKEALVEAMEKNVGFAMRYATFCNEKIQFLLRRIELLTMQSCRGKVIEYLLSHQDFAGQVTPDCSREDLARYLGVSRAALFRELSALQTQGHLAIENGIILIADQAGLEKILYQSAGSK